MTDSPLHIGFFSDVYAPQVNGVAISIHMVTKYLRKLGHQVTIFAPKFPGYLDAESGVYRLPSVRYMRMPPVYIAVPGTPRAALALRRTRFDILHAHTPLTLGLLAYLSAHFKQRPLIYTYHTAIADYTHYLKVMGKTGLMRRAVGRFSTFTCNASDQVVVPSAKFERLLQDQRVRRPVRVIPNGIDLQPFYATPPASGSFRARLGLSPDAPLLLFVGRLDPEKRPDFLIEAFARVAALRPDAQLVFAGDGTARAMLEKQAAASGMASRIRFLGFVNRANLPALFHDAALYLSASTTEVHPLAFIEAIASGLPVTVVWDEALKGMAEEGVNGRIVPREAGAFSSAIVEMLANRLLLAEQGQASVELSRKYSVEAQAVALVELYREAIAERARVQ